MVDKKVNQLSSFNVDTEDFKNRISTLQSSIEFFKSGIEDDIEKEKEKRRGWIKRIEHDIWVAEKGESESFYGDDLGSIDDLDMDNEIEKGEDFLSETENDI